MSIRPADVEKSLEAISKRLHPILESEAQNVLYKAKSMLLSSRDAFNDSVRQQSRGLDIVPWGFSIEPNDPLRFKKTKVKDVSLRVDLFLLSYWASDPADTPSELTLAIRVWCLDENIYFREDWDSERLSSQIDANTGRVMLRLHFDLANDKQPGPKYHLQIGGNPRDDEFHWFPESIDVPRILHHPMDLVLATELIAASFYPDRYRKFKREGQWVNSMKTSQGHLLAAYYERAKEAVGGEKSLLDSLWNVPGV